VTCLDRKAETCRA